MSRGGARIGAGRKPKPRVDPKTGGLLVPVRAVPTTNGVSPIEEFDAPDALTAEERAVWLAQAPHAFKNGTLTRASAMAFERYCRIVVMEAHTAKGAAAGGADHRGLLVLMNKCEQQFALTPCGKAMAVPAPPKPESEDVDDAFFGGPRGIVGGRSS